MYIFTGSALASQSVFETNSQYFSPNDLKQFQSTYKLASQSAIVKNGYATTTCSVDSCGEGNLDVQYIMAISQKTPTYYWYVTNTSETDPFLLYVLQLGDLSKPPLVNSISWGAVEQVFIIIIVMIDYCYFKQPQLTLTLYIYITCI